MKSRSGHSGNGPRRTFALRLPESREAGSRIGFSRSSEPPLSDMEPHPTPDRCPRRRSCGCAGQRSRRRLRAFLLARVVGPERAVRHVTTGGPKGRPFQDLRRMKQRRGVQVACARWGAGWGPSGVSPRNWRVCPVTWGTLVVRQSLRGPSCEAPPVSRARLRPGGTCPLPRQAGPGARRRVPAG